MSAEQMKFIENVHDYWAAIKSGTVKGANACTRSNDKIVRTWVEKEIEYGELTALLVHPLDTVKFEAAAYGINHSLRDESINVLRQIAEEKTCIAAPLAIAVLGINRISILKDG